VPQLNKIYCRHGIGVPIIAVRKRERSEGFQRQRQSWAATLVLRHSIGDDNSQGSMLTLELYDPLRVSSIANGSSTLPLAADTTAPLAIALSTVKRNYVQSFLQPGLVRPDETGLFMLEPYQPNKIPIIFIHGLLSDRLTWANMVNELISRPEFIDRFQLWGFEYPTGEPFLTSAKRLRHQMKQIRTDFDPHERDSAFNKIVLVGHSMGGLVSKMQITESGTQVWNSISQRNFEQTAMLEDTRKKFAEAVFFKPSPLVSRVVFIGTPHRGSALAQRAVGRVGSLLIDEPAELKAEHRRLLDDNPKAFSKEFSRRVPTSIDMLEPRSELLQAVNSLPLNPTVRTHSIIGQGRWMLGYGDSDGVVPVASAMHERSASTTMVTEKHAQLTRDPAVIEQVLMILREHYSEVCTK
jgi:pimeloyl-ACP methyl ester carboxylesterase